MSARRTAGNGSAGVLVRVPAEPASVRCAPVHGPAARRVKPRVPDPAAPFESWLLHRVAEAVEGNEVSAALLTDLHAAIAEVRARPPESRDALALMDLAERVNLPVDELTDLLATLEVQPIEARERFLRGFVEAWLMQQRELYDADHRGGGDGEDAGRQAHGAARGGGPRVSVPTGSPDECVRAARVAQEREVRQPVCLSIRSGLVLFLR